MAHARGLIDAHQYVLRSVWNEVQPSASAENAFESHSWHETRSGTWGSARARPTRPKRDMPSCTGTSGVSIRMGLIACHYRAAQCGATKRSSSLPTSSCSTWTKAAPDRVCETSFRRASAAAADGKHARVDGFASLSVLASAALVAAGLNRADPVIGLVITLVFLRIAWES